MMQQTGIYEQLITKLIESRLDRNRFYVGERQLDSSEASVWLSRFLSNILEFAIEAVPSGEDRVMVISGVWKQAEGVAYPVG